MIQLGLTDEQKATRRHFIGGSDAKIIVGGDDEAVIKLWRQKRGELPDDDLSNELPVMMGTFTEPFNVFWFEKQTGLKVTRQGDHAIHRGIPFMSATLDGYIASEHALLEAKHVGGFEPWGDVVQRYVPQMQHAMAVIDSDISYLSVFIGAGKWDMIKISADPFYQGALIERETDFWECVKSGNPPRALALTPPIINAIRTVDMQGNNAWAAAAADWKDNKAAAAKFEVSKTALKALVEPDVLAARGHGVIASRDKRGITIKEAG